MQNASDILSQVICTTALVLCGDCCPHLQMSRLRHRVRGPASPPSCCLQPLPIYASRLPIPPSLSGDPQNMEWVLSEDIISISLGDCIQPEKTSLVLICSHSSPRGRENLQLFFSDSNSPPIPTPTPRRRSLQACCLRKSCGHTSSSSKWNGGGGEDGRHSGDSHKQPSPVRREGAGDKARLGLCAAPETR